MSKYIKILNDSIRVTLYENNSYTLTATLFIPKPFVGMKGEKEEEDKVYGIYINNLFTGILYNTYDYGHTISIGILGFKIDIWWARNYN